MSKILVTGGCGMIGSNLVKRLVKEGHEVFVIDNLWRGKLEYLNDENGKPVIDLDTHYFNVDLSKGLGIDSIVFGVEYVVHLADIVAGSDYVFSNAEGFPMAVLDAWAYGVPVITTPVGGIPDIAKDGDNLLLFNPGDTDKLAYCLEQLISNKILRDKLSDESIYMSQTTFNIDTINNTIRSLYNSLIVKK